MGTPASFKPCSAWKMACRMFWRSNSDGFVAGGVALTPFDGVSMLGRLRARSRVSHLLKMRGCRSNTDLVYYAAAVSDVQTSVASRDLCFSAGPLTFAVPPLLFLIRAFRVYRHEWVDGIFSSDSDGIGGERERRSIA